MHVTADSSFLENNTCDSNKSSNKSNKTFHLTSKFFFS